MGRGVGGLLEDVGEIVLVDEEGGGYRVQREILVDVFRDIVDGARDAGVARADYGGILCVVQEELSEADEQTFDAFLILDVGAEALADGGGHSFEQVAYPVGEGGVADEIGVVLRRLREAEVEVGLRGGDALDVALIQPQHEALVGLGRVLDVQLMQTSRRDEQDVAGQEMELAVLDDVARRAFEEEVELRKVVGVQLHRLEIFVLLVVRLVGGGGHQLVFVSVAAHRASITQSGNFCK